MSSFGDAAFDDEQRIALEDDELRGAWWIDPDPEEEPQASRRARRTDFGWSRVEADR